VNPETLSKPLTPSKFKLKSLTVEHPSLYYIGKKGLYRCVCLKTNVACNQSGMKGFSVHTTFKEEGPRTVYGVFEDEMALGVALYCTNCEGRTVTTSGELWEKVPPWEVPSKPSQFSLHHRRECSRTL
jgi:hypothetical protein